MDRSTTSLGRARQTFDPSWSDRQRISLLERVRLESNRQRCSVVRETVEKIVGCERTVGKCLSLSLIGAKKRSTQIKSYEILSLDPHASLSLISAKKRSTQIKSYEILSLLLNYASIRSTTSLREILTESKLTCGSL